MDRRLDVGLANFKVGLLRIAFLLRRNAPLDKYLVTVPRGRSKLELGLLLPKHRLALQKRCPRLVHLLIQILLYSFIYTAWSLMGRSAQFSPMLRPFTVSAWE